MKGFTTTSCFHSFKLAVFSGFMLILLLPEISFAKVWQQPTHRVAYSQTRSLRNVVDMIAATHKVNIIYDVDQIEGVYVPAMSLSYSAEVDLQHALKGVNFTYKKLNDQTFVIKPKPVPVRQRVKATPPQPERITVEVTGFIVDAETKSPLVGASVVVKGANNGTLTTENGSFSLDAKVGDQLLIKYYGYVPRTIAVNQASLGYINLQPSTNNLEEVVVVGYGTQKRSDLTGALSSIGEKELKLVPATGLDQAIQGLAPGVYVTQNSAAPGGGVSIRIRGIGSTLSAEPLFVIDGIPVVNDNQGTSSNFSEIDGGGQHSNALNTINPNDIESIEILKDASATAIYGARAANGVVIITTKRGQAGKSRISFEFYFSSQELAKRIPVMNLQQYAEYYGDIGFEVIEEFERPELLGEGTDWQDEIFRRANMHNYQLTLSGGNQQTKYAFSGNYHFRAGTVVGSSFERISGKLNLDHNFSEKVRLGTSFLVSRTNERITFNDNSGGVIYTGLLMVPNAPVRNVDGSFSGPQEEITLAFDNPVARALETIDRNNRARMLANVYLEADLFPFLTYRTEFGSDINYSNHHTFFPAFERGNLFGKSGIRKSLSNSLFWINKHLLTYNQQIGENHRLTVLGGFEVQEGKFEWAFASRENLPTNELQQLTLGDAGQQTNDGGAGHWSLVSYFGRMNYNLADRYLLTATLRVDGSSRFGPNNRYGTFPSAAFAWKISNEPLLKNWAPLEDLKYNLKFRVGVGAVGNQEIGLYSYSANLRAISVVMGDQLITSFAPANIANPDVRWESSFQTNFGLNLGILEDRINLVLDYYVKRADGMLLPALLPATAGSLDPPFVNIGEIENRGVEIGLNTVNIAKKFVWRTTANFTHNRNEVINLGSNGNLTGILQRIPVTRTEEGQSISMFYGYVMEGIFQTQSEVGESPFQGEGTLAGDIKFKDLNEDGVIDDKDQTFIGSPHPDFTANLINDFRYKGFDLNIFLQGVYGNEILNVMRRDIEGMAGLTNQSVVVIDRFSFTKPSNEVPRATSNDPNANRRISDRFIEDGSFLRVKNVTLGYTLPDEWLRALTFKQMRIYASAQNFLTWTTYSGYDPDIGSFNQNPLINGVDNGRYPIAKSYTVGLNATF